MRTNVRGSFSSLDSSKSCQKAQAIERERKWSEVNPLIELRIFCHPLNTHTLIAITLNAAVLSGVPVNQASTLLLPAINFSHVSPIEWNSGGGRGRMHTLLSFFLPPPPQNPSQFSAQLEIKQQQRMHSAIVAEKMKENFRPIFRAWGLLLCRSAPVVQIGKMVQQVVRWNATDKLGRNWAERWKNKSKKMVLHQKKAASA